MSQNYCEVSYLYELLDPETKEVRYIGQTQNIKKRYNQHISERANTYKVNWIKNLKSRGLLPYLNVFRCVSKELVLKEEKFYIDFYTEQGYKLTNCVEPKPLKNKTKSKYTPYTGVSFNKNQENFVAFIEVNSEFKFIGGFKNQDTAKIWHDRVAKYYGLPVNEEPDITYSIEEAKRQIKKERSEGLGTIGVCKVKNSYSVTVTLNRKEEYIGCFKTLEEAIYYADAVRNYHSLFNNGTTEDKLSLEEARLKIAQSKPPKGIRKTGKRWSVRIVVDKKEYTIGKIETLEKAIYYSDALRNYYGLPNSKTTEDSLSLEEVKALQL